LIGADRAVLEMLDDVGKDLGTVDREAFDSEQADHDGDEADQRQQREHDDHRQQQATAPPRLGFDIGRWRFVGHGR
jgi:hypothetical protein